MNFSADSMMRSILDQSSHMFHVIVGLDPLGNFSAVENVAYENEPFEYAELGRNHAPIRLPWNPVGKPGDITLRWGMVVRSKMYSWMNDVKVGRDYRKSLYIIQLSRKRIPLRIYHLTGCFPTSWKSADFNTEQSAGVGTEELVIAYDQIDLLNLGLLSAAVGGIMDLLQDRSSNGVGDAMLEGYTQDYVGTLSNEDEDKAPPQYKSQAGTLWFPAMTPYLQNILSGEDLIGGGEAPESEEREGEEVERFSWESEGDYESNPDEGEDQVGGGEAPESEETEGEQAGRFRWESEGEYEGAPSDEHTIHDMKLYETIWGNSGLSEEELAAREEAWEALKAAWAERMGGG